MKWINFFSNRRGQVPVAANRVVRDFNEVESLASSIEGMLSRFSMQVMDAVLTHQTEAGIGGHVVEFGVYKCKSAAVLSAHVGASERLVLVDVNKQFPDETLDRLFVRPEFHVGKSENFSRTFADYQQLKKAVRFLHIDSSHTFKTTYAEMKLADELLTQDGIACMDDYTNLNYSQILPAIYKYLFTNRTDLTVFMVTNEKCYICRKSHFELYAGFVLNEILPALARRGNRSVSIARTDRDPEYKAFYVRAKETPDEDDRYGEKIYGHFYQKP